MRATPSLFSFDQARTRPRGEVGVGALEDEPGEPADLGMEILPER